MRAGSSSAWTLSSTPIPRRRRAAPSNSHFHRRSPTRRYGPRNIHYISRADCLGILFWVSGLHMLILGGGQGHVCLFPLHAQRGFVHLGKMPQTVRLEMQECTSLRNFFFLGEINHSFLGPQEAVILQHILISKKLFFAHFRHFTDFSGVQFPRSPR